MAAAWPSGADLEGAPVLTRPYAAVISMAKGRAKIGTPLHVDASRLLHILALTKFSSAVRRRPSVPYVARPAATVRKGEVAD